MRPSMRARISKRFATSRGALFERAPLSSKSAKPVEACPGVILRRTLVIDRPGVLTQPTPSTPSASRPTAVDAAAPAALPPAERRKSITRALPSW